MAVSSQLIGRRRGTTKKAPQFASVDPVLIIGAGASGLAAAAELRSLGVPTQVIERAAAVGDSWRSRYDCLELNTSRWMSNLRPADSFQGRVVFPHRDQVVSYLETFADRHEVNVRCGVEATRIDPTSDGWVVSTNEGPFNARHVIIAIGARHTPYIPDWPGRERYSGLLLHSTKYRNPAPFQDQDVLVVGAGCSGLDIARDLAEGGAQSVRLAVKSQPQLLLKSSLGIPTDVLVAVLYRLPTRLADKIGRIIQRVTVGNLSRLGLGGPGVGVFTQLRKGIAPVVVSPKVIAAVKRGRFGIVPGIAAMDADGVHLADGTIVQPDVVIAATGFGTGLEPLVGHLGVLAENGAPLPHRGTSLRPGLHFVGYFPSLDVIRRHAREVCQQLHGELAAG